MNGQVNMSSERVVSLGAIRYVSMSTLRDDWVAFVLGSSSEPDIFFSCVFKTELVTRLQILLRGLDLRIGPTYYPPSSY
jgi:myosin I